MKILPQKDGMDGFFATVLKRKWTLNKARRVEYDKNDFFILILFLKN